MGPPYEEETSTHCPLAGTTDRIAAVPENNAPAKTLFAGTKTYTLPTSHTLSTGLTSEGLPLRAKRNAPMSALSASLKASNPARLMPYAYAPQIRSKPWAMRK